MHARAPFLASALALALGLASGVAQADEPDEGDSSTGASAPVAAAPTPNVVIIENHPPPPTAAPQPVVVYDTPPKPPEGPEHEIWYGEQTLLLDGASTAMFIGAGLTANSRTNLPGMLALGGTLNFLFAPPIVHFAHGRIGPGFGSFALRVALPLEVAFDGMLIGAALTSNNNGEDIPAGPIYGGLIGLGVGAVGASIIDAALLARYTTREVDPEAYDPSTDAASDAPKKTSRAKPSIEWAPTASPVTGGATFGVGGVF